MFALTDKERQLLEALIKKGTIKEAALEMGIKKAAAYQILYRIRLRSMKAQAYLREVEKYKLRMPARFLE